MVGCSRGLRAQWKDRPHAEAMEQAARPVWPRTAGWKGRGYSSVKQNHARACLSPPSVPAAPAAPLSCKQSCRKHYASPARVMWGFVTDPARGYKNPYSSYLWAELGTGDHHLSRPGLLTQGITVSIYSLWCHALREVKSSLPGYSSSLREFRIATPDKNLK